MRLTYMLAAAAALLTASPAVAQSFTGPRLEATVSGGDVNKIIDRSDTSYGAAAGYDFALSDKVRLGVEGNVDNVFDKDRTLGVEARLGYVVARKLLVYGAVGYEDYKYVRRLRDRNLDGLRYGGGAEVALTDHLFVKGEYRRTNLDGRISRDAVLFGGGVRF